MKVVQNVIRMSNNHYDNMPICQYVRISICQYVRMSNGLGIGCLREEYLNRERGTRDKMIINSTQKVSSRVLKSRNMMSVARTS